MFAIAAPAARTANVTNGALPSSAAIAGTVAAIAAAATARMKIRASRGSAANVAMLFGAGGALIAGAATYGTAGGVNPTSAFACSSSASEIQ